MPKQEDAPSTKDKRETREERFKRLAEARVNSTINKIEIIGNLASNNYAFTSEQVEKIIITLKAAVDELENKFEKILDKKDYQQKRKFEL